MTRARKRKPASSMPPRPPGPTLPGCLLALDLGSRQCGYAFAKLDAQAKVLERDSGAIALEDVSPVRWKRVDFFAKWLTWAIAQHQVTWLAVEEPHTQRDNVGTRHLMHGLYAFADVISGRLLNQPVTPISRMDVFQATLGWRMRPLDNAERLVWEKRKKRPPPKTVMRCPTKQEVLSAVNARGHKVITSEDEADAVAALDMVLAELAGTGGIAPAPALPPVVEVSMPPALAQLQGELAKLPQTPVRQGPVIRPARGRRRSGS